MNASDFPGLLCPDCDEVPAVRHTEGIKGYVAPYWNVCCACGGSSPDRPSAPLAVAAWEAGQRDSSASRQGKDRSRVYAAEAGR